MSDDLNYWRSFRLFILHFVLLDLGRTTGFEHLIRMRHLWADALFLGVAMGAKLVEQERRSP